MADAARPIEIPAEPCRETSRRLYIHAALPNTVEFLIAEKVVQRRRTANVNDVALRVETLIAKTTEDREPLVQRVRRRSGIQTNVVFIRGFEQFAIAHVESGSITAHDLTESIGKIRRVEAVYTKDFSELTGTKAVIITA